uniref:Zinc finger GRF-type domain-containing protein n=1 Tax=Oryza brachyantha TaxID=4533 RepID=J3L7S8_ORYBR
MICEAKGGKRATCKAECHDWRVQPRMLPPWLERLLCSCGNRCMVFGSMKQKILGQRFFACSTIVDDGFMNG